MSAALRLIPLVLLLATTGCAYDYASGRAPDYPAGYDDGIGSGQYAQPGDLFGTQNVAAVDVFYRPLSAYGDWVNSGYGTAFRPRVGREWRPYVNGRWGENRLWISDDPWGWATDHYGRWGHDDRYGWVWVPGTEWAPSWVAYRESQEVAGWAPIPPGVRYSYGGGFGNDWGYDSWNSWYAPSWVWVSRSSLYQPGFGGRILPWSTGYGYWGSSRWNWSPPRYGRQGYDRPGYGYDRPGYSNARPGYGNAQRGYGYGGSYGNSENRPGDGYYRRPDGYGRSNRPDYGRPPVTRETTAGSNSRPDRGEFGRGSRGFNEPGGVRYQGAENARPYGDTGPNDGERGRGMTSNSGGSDGNTAAVRAPRRGADGSQQPVSGATSPEGMGRNPVPAAEMRPIPVDRPAAMRSNPIPEAQVASAPRFEPPPAMAAPRNDPPREAPQPARTEPEERPIQSHSREETQIRPD